MGENGLLEKVKQAITSNITVKGLMRDLQDAGMNVKNELETIVLAEDYWIKINDIERGPLENYKVDELKELPFTSVRNNGTEYRIHGITHDESSNKKTLSNRTRNFYKEASLKLSNPHEREKCLYEPGMTGVLQIKDADEILVFDMFHYKIRKYVEFLFKRKKLERNWQNLDDELKCKLHGNEDRINDSVRKVSIDPSYLPLFREAYKRQQFPLPLEIEKTTLKHSLYAGCPGLFKYKAMFYFCVPALSKEYAKQFKQLAKFSKLKTAHLIVGLAHESDIAYYLQNSESSFQQTK